MMMKMKRNMYQWKKKKKNMFKWKWMKLNKVFSIEKCNEEK